MDLIEIIGPQSEYKKRILSERKELEGSRFLYLFLIVTGVMALFLIYSYTEYANAMLL